MYQTCVESLTLLSELSIHARIGLNLWQLLGAATRTAVAINLHRRDDVYLPTVFGLAYSESHNSAEIAAHNQRRKDLFWALYSLDRLAAFILNRPPSLADTDVDVDVSFFSIKAGLEHEYGLKVSRSYHLLQCGQRGNTPLYQARRFGRITSNHVDYMARSRLRLTFGQEEATMMARCLPKRSFPATCNKYSNGT